MSLTLLLVKYAPLFVLINNGLLPSLPVFALQNNRLGFLVNVRLYRSGELAAGRSTAPNALQEPSSPDQIIQSNFTF